MLGVNESGNATCFPVEVTTAASWDPALLEEIGGAIGEEARAQGVGTSLKHFVVDLQERSRFNFDRIFDERTLREMYLTAFEIAVKEGKPSTVMCAYPKLNSTPCSDHRGLLTDILRTEWGFDGMVVTDWGAMNDRPEGFAAGCDLNMPGGSAYMEKAALAAGKAGTLPERFESEWFDRESMEMPEGHLRMIEAVSRANPNTVVVRLRGGVPVGGRGEGHSLHGSAGTGGR